VRTKTGGLILGLSFNDGVGLEEGNRTGIGWRLGPIRQIQHALRRFRRGHL